MVPSRYVLLTLCLAMTILPADADDTLPAVQSSESLQQLVQAKGCASCHGTRGQGNAAMKGPKLAGQSAEGLAHKLQGYRSREIHNPTMNVMSYRLTDQEISLLAEYFSRFK